MSISVTKQQIGNQLDYVISIWRENTKNALAKMKYPKISNNTFLSGVSLLNAGKDAVTTLYPNSKPGKLLATSWAPPVFILSQAATGFDGLYKAYISSHNKLLTAKYDTLKRELFSSVDKASISFKATQYGLDVTDQIFSSMKNIKFKRAADADVLVRHLILEANFIETDMTKISMRLDQGYGNLCRTLYKIYLGTYRGPGYNNRMYLEFGHLQIYGSGRTGYATAPIKTKAEQDKIMAEAWKYAATHIDRVWLDKLPDTTTIRKQRDRPYRVSLLYKGPKLKLDKAVYEKARASFKKHTGRTPETI
jgi:hypothetical protein